MPAKRAEPFVSTGALPSVELVQELVSEAYESFRASDDGELSDVYPALARASRDVFGIAVVSAGGDVFAVGDAEVEFTIMSVAKPFVFALVSDLIGVDEARDRLGVNATGLPFNSAEAIEQSADGRTNPMVNAGAIATVSLVPGTTTDERWDFIRDGLSRFAARELALDDEVYTSASETNHTNRELARLLESRHRIYCDPGKQSTCIPGRARLPSLLAISR